MFRRITPSKLKQRLRREWFQWSVRTRRRSDMVRLGTAYGGWAVPGALLGPDSNCYLAGAGDDISFDLALVEKFGCHVHSFDPTPRAIEYVTSLALETPKFRFHPYGVWSSDTMLRFYEPSDPAHVSYSAVNLQKTRSFIEAPCKSISSIMGHLNHDQIDLLKLDIEGAEYEVLQNILAERIVIRVLCVEFDQPASLRKIARQIRTLQHAGYQPVATEGWNVTLVHEEHRPTSKKDR